MSKRTEADDSYLAEVATSTDDTRVSHTPVSTGDVLGIDIGGSGIKGAPVDPSAGELRVDRQKILTPDGAEPHDVAKVVAELAERFEWDGPIGCTFPSIIKDGVALIASNVSKAWIGTNVDDLLTEATGCPTSVINDADAAGLAEMRHGAGAGRDGVVITLTFGTGIGGAVFVDGKLLPNVELGLVQLWGDKAEKKASAHARERDDLSFEVWAKTRVQPYLSHIELLFSPDLIILGGGVSRKADKWIPHLKTRAELAPATLRNNAGIVGAAMTAKEAQSGKGHGSKL